jgi:hypothetical protein
LANNRLLFAASLQRFWVEPISDWALVKPIRRLAHDLSHFDDRVVDRLMGVPAPAINVASTLAQLEERRLAARLDNSLGTGNNAFVKDTGLLGTSAGWVIGLAHWFEERLILQGMGKGALDVGRKIGHLANKLETLVLRPRYLVLLVFITLLVAS